jgi:hypothetical protein
MALSRTHVERLVANAVRPEETIVDLPSLGEKLRLRRPSNTDRVDVLSSLDDRDSEKLVATVWIMAVDDETGERLFRTKAETAAFINQLEPGDLGEIVNGIGELVADDDTEEPEAGKVS